ncbi:hypothetical protein ACFQT0_11740 [Hymenobacter humi]|uniref:Uncharacterized protein n=1 Tax=Hymenobacter humi TaxID=1411620 RepID=A0ABW2U573_9BACT
MFTAPKWYSPRLVGRRLVVDYLRFARLDGGVKQHITTLKLMRNLINRLRLNGKAVVVFNVNLNVVVGAIGEFLAHHPPTKNRCRVILRRSVKEQGIQQREHHK